MSADNGNTKFGTCCEGLKEAMAGEGFEPLIAEEDGVLYMSIGFPDDDGDEGHTMDAPVYFCPFCGLKLQTPEAVEAKIGPAD
jgi:hypothetical protein